MSKYSPSFHCYYAETGLLLLLQKQSPKEGTVPADSPSISYQDADIQALRRGKPQSYLPEKNKINLEGCFACESNNPYAPYVTQAGNLPRVTKKADLLAS
jgi:hypothetical protein